MENIDHPRSIHDRNVLKFLYQKGKYLVCLKKKKQGLMVPPRVNKQLCHVQQLQIKQGSRTVNWCNPYCNSQQYIYIIQGKNDLDSKLADVGCCWHENIWYKIQVHGTAHTTNNSEILPTWISFFNHDTENLINHIKCLSILCQQN